MQNSLSCCFTGYRPEKFGFQLSEHDPLYNQFVARLYSAIIDLAESGVTTFYTGMAMGFDIIAAETVIDIMELRKELCLRLIACVPYIDQSNGFPTEWKQRYEAILEKCDKALLISDRYYKGCFQRRNRYMVDSSDFVITYFDGSSGGTKNTVNYAEKCGKAVVNCYEK